MTLSRQSASGVTNRRRWHATLLWLGPALALILGVVLFPVVKLVEASLGRYSITGLRLGGAGGANYTNVFRHPDLSTVLTNTVVWVVSVVAITVVISLGLAQFLVKDFRGHSLVRWALIVPWAASLVVTSQLFVLLYDYHHGMINHLLTALHLVEAPIDFLGDDRFTMASMVAVGIFVSIPFTTYTFIAGLDAIPADVFEAARLDGASPWQTWRRVTLPLLRPSLMIACVLNVIYVFNSFPIVYTLNDRNPGYLHDTTITFMYKLAFKSQEKDVGMSAAAGIVNMLLILLVVVAYLKVVDWRKAIQS
ncbi:carbohydrate ABC transporter membrane protein 1, CUT1 family [Austwickia chelonae]|uniref:Putative ABC transport system permease protein n=1 Tax=Austwickia chelonae NBRC 105200 TaxID=1184607 RepID=K6VPV4_9MICO|nr:sugar ABC transporter permease [Austwickia chelonae]GAB77405.1 putative ABC transport system permease protein [Austwickia chelonae NBRC 105200]SEW09728.1 carbohydrate ABC transporter membrane protein 1, CUT1 family [Austwickia chelonae]